MMSKKHIEMHSSVCTGRIPGRSSGNDAKDFVGFD
jgi:hypothetical protein